MMFLIRRTLQGNGLCERYLLVHELLVGLVAAGQFKRGRYGGFALLDAGDYVGAAHPVSFGEIGGRPLGGMIGMGVVEADDIFSALAAFALNADQLFRIDLVAVVGRIVAHVSAAGGTIHGLCAVIFKASEQYATALVGKIG